MTKMVNNIIVYGMVHNHYTDPQPALYWNGGVHNIYTQLMLPLCALCVAKVQVGMWLVQTLVDISSGISSNYRGLFKGECWSEKWKSSHFRLWLIVE